MMTISRKTALLALLALPLSQALADPPPGRGGGQGGGGGRGQGGGQGGGQGRGRGHRSGSSERDAEAHCDRDQECAHAATGGGSAQHSAAAISGLGTRLEPTHSSTSSG